MRVRFVVDQAAAAAPYLQVRDQILAAIRSGRLPVGTRLPAIRKAAESAGIAPGTVARAYRELEAQGVLDTRGRYGTFVSDPAGSSALHRRELSELAESYAGTAARYGIEPAAALELIARALRDQG